MKPRRPFNKRRYEPQEIFSSKFSEAVLDLTNSFLKSKKFQHSLTKGEEREVPIREFFSENLPQSFDVVKGEVIDIYGTQSPQMDLMIFNQHKNIRIYSGDSSILPAEALLASIEVKSSLNKNDIISSLKAVQKLKSLKPFRRSLDSTLRGRENHDKVICRYFHSIFAYGTDISETDWAEKEISRLREIASEQNIDFTLIDRIYVVGRGIINPLDNSVASEEKDSSIGFMYFYMHLLNFLQRENKRREIVPYIDYAGQMSKGWKRF